MPGDGGINGRDGQPGVPGRKGEAGLPGFAGPDGARGLDGMAVSQTSCLEYLHSIIAECKL